METVIVGYDVEIEYKNGFMENYRCLAKHSKSFGVMLDNVIELKEWCRTQDNVKNVIAHEIVRDLLTARKFYSRKE